MTALAVGSSVTLTPSDGGTIAIATNGGFASIVITPTVGSVQTINLGPAPERRVLGPFSEGASVSITNNSCNSFDYGSTGGYDPGAVAITGGSATLSALSVTAPPTLTGQTTGTVVGAAGAAAALPAAPLGYLTLSINGSNVRVPYYN